MASYPSMYTVTVKENGLKLSKSQESHINKASLNLKDYAFVDVH